MSWDRNAQLAAIATLDDRDSAVLRAWFPCSQLLTGDRLAVAIEQFRTQPSPIESSTEARAARWAACLAAVIVEDPAAAGYAADVAKYEGIVADLALSARAADDAGAVTALNAGPATNDEAAAAAFPYAGTHVRFAHFFFDAPSIVAAIEDCDRLGEHERPAPCIALFVQKVDRPRPDVMIVSPGIELLLGLCDGTRSTAQIVEDMRAFADGEDAEDLEARTMAALVALRARHAIIDRRAGVESVS